MHLLHLCLSGAPSCFAVGRPGTAPSPVCDCLRMFKQTSTLRDIKAAGEFDAKDELPVVNKATLIQYIVYLSTELAKKQEALDVLKSSFKETLTDLTTAQKSSIEAINLAASSVTTAAVQKIEQLTTNNNNVEQELGTKIDQLQTCVTKLQVETTKSTVPLLDQLQPTNDDVSYIDTIMPISKSVEEFISQDLADRIEELLKSADWKAENGHRVI